ncbi:low-temperature-induced 65 kDa protein-like isoform X2 [Juglans regia]|uniref:Low-temperature-induced 65 kDa protein-like isoform X2 n=1 Tax=Juglans regia TaxID=51240 RepID=A0A6P9F4Q1_JUGRE|nr:low-temperature-induced 65 kDa protein-like isoform X2 [Juglans regia]
MDSRTEHPSAEGREDEHPHEKTSMFKKVKAKAKRMKDTLKKHGQGPDQDHHENHPDERLIPDDHDLDKEDDEDEEMVEDPEVHPRTETENSGKSKLDFGRLGATREDAPSPGERHESKIIKPIKGIEPNTDQPISKFGNPIVSGEKPHAPQNTPVSRPPGDYGTKATDPTKTSLLGERGGTGQPKVNLERPMGLEEDRHAPKDRSEPHNPANYRTKVTDPKGTGGEEAGIDPILQSFEKMKVHDEQSPKPTGPDDNSPTTIRQQSTKSPTRSPDQFSPETVPPEVKIVRDKSQLPHSFDATKLPGDSEPMNQRSSTEEVSPATSTIFDKAISAKNVVASKIGYGEQSPKPTGPDDDSPTTKTKLPGDSRDISEEPMNQRSSTEEVSPATSTIFDKAISAKNAVASKIGYGEQSPKKQTGPDDDSPTTKTKLPDDSRDISEEPMNQRSSTEKVSPATSTIADKAIFAKNAVASKIGYGEPKPKPTGPDDDSPTTKTKLPDDSRDISEEPMNQRSSTEEVSPATSTIADKAISAKNAVASKLGYGDKDMTSGTEVRQSGDNAKSSPAEYGKKIAATETENQNPVYEKPASKVHGTGITDTDLGIGNESRSSDVKGQDKGVSVKDYFMEKSRPGDEDRALAEVISDTLHKPNEKPGEGEMRPMGKVTESEEVARQLGTKEDNSCQGMQSSDVNNSQEKGVVDKFKGAVGSWFGLGGESQPQVSPQPHDGSSYGDEVISRSANGDGGNSSPTADEGKRLKEI